MLRLTTLTSQYYRSLLLYNISFTVCLIVLSGFGMGFDPVSLFYCKVFGFIGAALLHYYTAPFTYFYYRNAGMSIRRLFILAASADVALSLVLIFPIYFLFHATTHA